MAAAIIGVGLHPFGPPGSVTAQQMAVGAIRAALADAQIEWPDVQAAWGGSHESGNADVLVNHLGLSGIEFTNVYNGCATGASCLRSGFMAIASGEYDLVLAVGFDAHPRGAFQLDPQQWGLGAWYGAAGLMLTTQFFAMRIQRYMHDFGISAQSLAAVAEKNYANGAATPHAWRRTALSREAIAASPMISHPLTKYMFCSPSSGAAAVVLASERYANQQKQRRAVWLRSVAVRGRKFGTFEVFNPSRAVVEVAGPTAYASRTAYEMAGVAPEDVDIAQLQDTDAGAEIIHMAENHLCAHGEQEAMVRAGDTTLRGRIPVNTDGGCMANGEPIGASALRQICELTAQLRGEAGQRQIPKQPKVGYAHVYGAPGLAAVSILTR
jgi:acetyl-CoA C-acetyltransferase